MREYKICISHFYCLEYSEENHRLLLDIDFRDMYFILNKSLINKWESPFENEIISDEKK